MHSISSAGRNKEIERRGSEREQENELFALLSSCFCFCAFSAWLVFGAHNYAILEEPEPEREREPELVRKIFHTNS